MNFDAGNSGLRAYYAALERDERPGPGDPAGALADPHDRGGVRSGAGAPGLGVAVGVKEPSLLSYQEGAGP